MHGWLPCTAHTDLEHTSVDAFDKYLQKPQGVNTTVNRIGLTWNLTVTTSRHKNVRMPFVGCSHCRMCTMKRRNRVTNLDIDEGAVFASHILRGVACVQSSALCPKEPERRGRQTARQTGSSLHATIVNMKQPHAPTNPPTKFVRDNFRVVAILGVVLHGVEMQDARRRPRGLDGAFRRLRSTGTTSHPIGTVWTEQAHRKANHEQAPVTTVIGTSSQKRQHRPQLELQPACPWMEHAHSAQY
jgi:hypothetical protein